MFNVFLSFSISCQFLFLFIFITTAILLSWAYTRLAEIKIMFALQDVWYFYYFDLITFMCFIYLKLFS